MTAKTSNTVKFVQPAAKRYARVLYELEIPKADIEKTIENRNLQDQILEVLIPLQTVVEEKNGEMKTAHGLRRADSVGLAAMRLQAYFTAIVVNMKRIVAVIPG